jgi:hypothetical protein
MTYVAELLLATQHESCRRCTRAKWRLSDRRCAGPGAPGRLRQPRAPYPHYGCQPRLVRWASRSRTSHVAYRKPSSQHKLAKS